MRVVSWRPLAVGALLVAPAGGCAMVQADPCAGDTDGVDDPTIVPVEGTTHGTFCSGADVDWYGPLSAGNGALEASLSEFLPPVGESDASDDPSWQPGIELTDGEGMRVDAGPAGATPWARASVLGGPVAADWRLRVAGEGAQSGVGYTLTTTFLPFPDEPDSEALPGIEIIDDASFVVRFEADEDTDYARVFGDEAVSRFGDGVWISVPEGTYLSMRVQISQDGEPLAEGALASERVLCVPTLGTLDIAISSTSAIAQHDWAEVGLSGSGCGVPASREVEPNGDVAHAATLTAEVDAFTSPAGVGLVAPAGDVDIWALPAVKEDASVHLELAGPATGSTLFATMTVVDAGGSVLKRAESTADRTAEIEIQQRPGDAFLRPRRGNRRGPCDRLLHACPLPLTPLAVCR